MNFMFYFAVNFNQDLKTWKIDQLTNKDMIFEGTANYA